MASTLKDMLGHVIYRAPSITRLLIGQSMYDISVLSEILFVPQEHKIHIFELGCHFLFIKWIVK